MALHLVKDGQDRVVYDRYRETVEAAINQGTRDATELPLFVKMLAPPRVVWLMVSADVVDVVIGLLVPLLNA